MSIATNYQLSIFGKFSISPSPENIAVLMEKINQEIDITMLPNMIQSQQIEFPSNRITNLSNLGFVSQDQRYNIAILNDRIDVNYNKVDEKDIEKSDFYVFAIKMLSSIVDLFNVKSNRLAANFQFVCEVDDLKNMREKGKKLLKNADFYSEKEYMEWALRTNAIESISVNGNEEKINIITDISSNQDITSSQPIIVFHVDINTLPQNTDLRFAKESLEPFVDKMLPIASCIISDVERLIINE